MSLRAQATADAKLIIEDRDGFGLPVTVTDPDGRVVCLELTGLTTDVHQILEPETGQAVSGRQASVTLRMGAFTERGLGLPQGIADTSRKPWVVSFSDADGTEHTFKVTDAMPDRAVGLVVCMLEFYKP